MNVLSASQYENVISAAQSSRPIEELLCEIQPVDEERKTQRTEALKKLQLLLKVWAGMVVYQSGQPDKIVTQKHLRLIPYGSYKYDDQSKDSDVDLLCVTSRFITRKHFFSDLGRLFEGMKEVEGFTVLLCAFIPIIKMKFHGVSMDICFSQLTTSSVPQKFTLEYISRMNFTDMDDKSVTSLNGYIMTSRITELVPRFNTFTTTLNTIKLWAKRRGVYSAVLGFLGGSSYSLLVAKICQLYPDATPTELTSLFFHFYAAWDWSQPITLSSPTPLTDPFPRQPWVNPSDSSKDPIQIIPPLYPPANSAHKVSHSSLLILRQELQKAAKITSRKAEKGWKELFEGNPKEFFCKYPVYVQVVVGALKDGGEDGARKWEGWTKSRIAGLVKSLEQQEGVEIAHLNTKQFVHQSTSTSEPETTQMFIGLAMDDKLPHPLPCATTTQFVRNVSNWREFDPTRMGVRVDFVPLEHVPQFIRV